MNREYVEVYEDLYRRHWWWRSRERLLLREIRAHEPNGGWCSILDVGCGNGLFFDPLLRHGEVWGIEADPAMVAPTGKHRSRIHVGAFDHTYRAPSPFRLVLMLDVLEHMTDPGAALRQVRDLLAPGGRLLVTVPAFPALWTRHDDINQHVMRYTAGSFAEMTRTAGLRVFESRYLFYWLFPAKLLVRGLEWIRPGSPRPTAVPAALVNRTLFALSVLEERALGWARLPFGSSLLAWCGAPDESSTAVSAPANHLPGAPIRRAG